MVDRPEVRLAAVCAGLAAAVFVVATVSILATRDHTEIAAVWPVNALALAAICAAPRGQWPPLLASAYVANLAANFVAGNGWSIAVFCSAANVVEILICASVLLRGQPASDDVAQPVRFFARLFVGAVLGGVASAVIATIAMAPNAKVPLPELFVSWLVADVLGLVIFSPGLIALRRLGVARALRGNAPWRRAGLVYAAFGAGVAAIFLQDQVNLLPLAPLLLMILAFQLHASSVALGVGVMAIVAIAATTLGIGPVLQHPGHVSNLAYLQGFLALLSLAGTPAAGAVAQRQQLLQEVSEARDAVRDRLNQWTALAEASPDIIVRAGPGGIIRYVSPACRTLLGIEPEDALGRSTAEFADPADRAFVEGILRDLFSGAEPDPNLRRIFRARGADGATIWLEGNPSVIYGADGRPAEFLTLFRNVTVRRQMELDLASTRDDLARRELKLRTLAESARDILVRYLPDLTITYVSPACETVLGYKPEELVGSRTEDFVLPEDRPKAQKLLIDAVRSGEFVNIQLRARHRNGAVVWMEGRPRAVFDPQTRKVVAFYDVMRDVTEQVALRDQYIEAVARAEAAARVRSEFVANMSHELRTPLNSVIGYARLLAQSEALDPRDRRFARHVESASQATLSIVNDVLDIAAIEKGAIALREGPVSLASVLEETAVMVGPQADAKGLAVAVHADPDIVTLRGDRDRLRQIALNLASNAVKFSDAGSVRLAADLVADEGDFQVVRLSVSDDGVGIAESDHAAIFDRFVQVGATQVGGSGLGLSIVKGLVDAMGGEVSVRSAPGAGATFAVALTLGKAGPHEIHRRHEPAQTRQLSILVVDDVDLNRELAALVLARHGHTVATADSGDGALARCLGEQFDLIFMDLRMPGMGGIEAARAIRKSGGPSADAAIVALTAGVRSGQVAECMAAGMDGYVVKPIVEEELMAAVAANAGFAGATLDITGAMADLRQRFLGQLLRDRETLAGADAEALASVAHRLSGSAASLGFEAVGACAVALDEEIERGGAGVEAARRDLLDEIDRTIGRAAA